MAYSGFLCVQLSSIESGTGSMLIGRFCNMYLYLFCEILPNYKTKLQAVVCMHANRHPVTLSKDGLFARETPLCTTLIAQKLARIVFLVFKKLTE